MKKTSIFGMIVITIGILIALTPEVILPVCRDTLELTTNRFVPMKCHWMSCAEIAVGVNIVLVGILALIFRKKDSALVLSVISFLLGLTALLVPTSIIGVCMTRTMPCHMGTQPALIILSSILMLVSLIKIIFGFAYGKKEVNDT